MKKDDLYTNLLTDIFVKKSDGKCRASEDIYLILSELIGEGYISAHTDFYKENIEKNYYHIESKGREYYKKILKDYRAETKAIHNILGIEYDYEVNIIRTAIIGSGNLHIDDEDIKKYLPKGTTEIISGGPKGIDTCVKNYAQKNKISLTEILPDYEKYGRSALLRRNIKIIERADFVLAFWDGKSRGTAFIINQCKEMDVSVRIIRM